MAYNDMQSSVYWGGFRTGPLGPEDAVDWNEGVDSKGTPLHIKHHSHSAKFARLNGDGSEIQAMDESWDKWRRKNWQVHEAPRDMVAEMHKQIMTMHGVTKAPAPIDAAFIDWSDDPFGGAVHFWNPGYKSWEIMPEMVKPNKDFPCLIVGEAWSENQTWAEGSLQTSEIALQSHFGLLPPNWIKNDK
jgi:hypothetical protein